MMARMMHHQSILLSPGSANEETLKLEVFLGKNAVPDKGHPLIMDIFEFVIGGTGQVAPETGQRGDGKTVDIPRFPQAGNYQLMAMPVGEG